MRSDTIVGYSYKADVYCPEDVVKRLLRDHGLEGHGLSHVPEEALERMAISLGVDRMDERTYDSDDFPKVIFADQVEDGFERCNVCHESLKGDA